MFALGLIAHELVCGRAAFAEPPAVARMRGRAVAEADASALPPLLARCLALAPTARPSAAELARELGAAATGS